MTLGLNRSSTPSNWTAISSSIATGSCSSKLHLLCILTLMSIIIYYIYRLSPQNEALRDAHQQLSLPRPSSLENKEYAVIIDAGSSGSRVFIYTWPPHNGISNELLQITPLHNSNKEPLLKKIEPGLSSVAAHPWTASDYIQPLLQFASENIPPEKHKDTSLYIMATAGLRLLDVDTQNSILEDLRSDIPKNFSFRLASTNIEVISGKQEGIFQWIAINYVLGRFNHNSNGPIIAVDVTDVQPSSPMIFRKRTVGILDMGGASMQIALELTSKMQLDSLLKENKNAVTEVDLGCKDHNNDHKYRVYVATYLGMGANEGFDKYVNWLVNESGVTNENRSAIMLNDPCMTAGLAETFNSSVNESLITGILNGTGDFDLCLKYLQTLFKQLFLCSGAAPCLTQQLPFSLDNNDFYGFSEFWYSMEDVLRIGGNYQYYKFRKASKNYCSTHWSVLERRFENHEYPLSDLSRLKYQCFKSAWLSVVLHNALKFSIDFDGLRSSPNTVKGAVVHWSLGAVILKTRFLPLREIQKTNPLLPNKVTGSGWTVHLNSYAFVVCFAVVLAAILIYLQRLNCLKRTYWKELPSELQFESNEDLMEHGYSR